MRLTADDARARFGPARVARLATADADGRPHLVPVTFAVVDDRIAIAIDRKPKRGHDLRRLRNIAQNPQVSVLVDHYDEDWPALWWARADGTARILVEDERGEPVAALRAKYPQYVDSPPDGPVIDIAADRWTGWAYSP